jgi:hypothetical protein
LNRIFEKLNRIFEKLNRIFEKLNRIFEKLNRIFEKLNRIFEKMLGGRLRSVATPLFVYKNYIHIYSCNYINIFILVRIL